MSFDSSSAPGSDPGRRATAPGEVAPALAGPSVPGYLCGERIGQGGAGAVWAAVREKDGAQAAIKIGHSAAPVPIARFRREAEALRRIGPPHTARLNRANGTG